jgi:hypothetical protein
LPVWETGCAQPVEQVRPPTHESLRVASVGDLETIDSELRLLAAVRRVCREQDGILPSFGPVDELLDERRELDRKLTGS